MKRKNPLQLLIRQIFPLICMGAAILCLLNAAGNLESGQNEEGRRQLEDTLRRAAVSCYASEGIYPPTLDYLEDHYGMQINRDKYTVFYDAFAENLMPDITVLSNENG